MLSIFRQRFTGPQAFLAPCAVAGAVITLAPLIPGGAGSSITAANTATPGGAGHVFHFSSVGKHDRAAGLSESVSWPFRSSTRLPCWSADCAWSRADLTWLLANSGKPAVGGLDLTKLPVTASQPPLALGSLLTTLLLIKLARLWKAAPPTSTIQNPVRCDQRGWGSGGLASQGIHPDGTRDDHGMAAGRYRVFRRRAGTGLPGQLPGAGELRRAPHARSDVGGCQCLGPGRLWIRHHAGRRDHDNDPDRHHGGERHRVPGAELLRQHRYGDFCWSRPSAAPTTPTGPSSGVSRETVAATAGERCRSDPPPMARRS